MLHSRVANIDQVDVGIIQHAVEPAIAFDGAKLEFPGRRAEVAAHARPVAGQLLRVAAANRGDCGVGEFLRGQIVNAAHEADADNADADHDVVSAYVGGAVAVFYQLRNRQTTK